MNNFTRRELIVFAIIVVLIISFLFFPSLLNSDYELLYLLLVVLPLGIFIMTDKERLARLQENEPSDLHCNPTGSS